MKASRMRRPPFKTLRPAWPGEKLVVTRGPRAAGTAILAAREWRGNGRKAI
jgi:hypothetical protein